MTLSTLRLPFLRFFVRQLPVCLGAALLAPLALAQDSGYVAWDVMIPMRDGVELYTQIFEPVGAQEPSPILFTRTPYRVDPLPTDVNPETIGPSPIFANAGYTFVHQDVRGMGKSGGVWQMLEPMRSDRSSSTAVDESTDAYDTTAWLLENIEGNNGRVGMWGISYDGWEAVMAMADAHPALLAVSPQASVGDFFLGDDAHHNGAFRLNYMFFWLAYMTMLRGDLPQATIAPVFYSDAYTFFKGAGSLTELRDKFFSEGGPGWTDLLEHGDYDEFWEERNVIKHLDHVKPAVLNVAGWFDGEDFRGPLDIYSTVEGTASNTKNHLVVGPWQHGGWSAAVGDGTSMGDLDFGAQTALRFQEGVEFPFFELYLKETSDAAPVEALVFETGSNQWHELNEWPPLTTKAKELYLHADGQASFRPPTKNEGHTAFTSDPLDPVPHTSGAIVLPDPNYMVEDQRYLEGREDVISFVTEPLKDDLVIAGEPLVELQFRTTGTDADWVVKLIDIYPGDTDEVSAATGKSLANAEILIVGEIFRAKYRESFKQPTPLEPDVITTLKFELPDRFHNFRAGHRIMVQVHSTWFPMYDRNPQQFMDIYSATAEDYTTQEHHVVHQQDAASFVLLPVWSEE